MVKGTRHISLYSIIFFCWFCLREAMTQPCPILYALNVYAMCVCDVFVCAKNVHACKLEMNTHSKGVSSSKRSRTKQSHVHVQHTHSPRSLSTHNANGICKCGIENDCLIVVCERSVFRYMWLLCCCCCSCCCCFSWNCLENACTSIDWHCRADPRKWLFFCCSVFAVAVSKQYRHLFTHLQCNVA